MALYFPVTCSKTFDMPNSANQSKNNSDSGKGHAEGAASKASAPKPNPERSDLKHGEHPKDHKGDTSRSSNQGRKEASGGGND